MSLRPLLNALNKSHSPGLPSRFPSCDWKPCRKSRTSRGNLRHLGAVAPVQNLPWFPNHCAATTPPAYGWGSTSHTPFSKDKKAPGPGSIPFPVYRRADNLLQRQDSATGWLGPSIWGQNVWIQISGPPLIRCGSLGNIA